MNSEQPANVPLYPGFGDLCMRVAGEVWGKPLIDQTTKAMLTIAIDVANQGLVPESPNEVVHLSIHQVDDPIQSIKHSSRRLPCGIDLLNFRLPQPIPPLAGLIAAASCLAGTSCYQSIVG